MSWMERLLPWRRTDDTTEVAQRELARLEDRDEHVARLHHELREAQRRNHFSELVARAIDRSTPKPKEN